MRILITYGWCRTAYGVAQGLAALRPKCDVYVCDSTQLSMTRFSKLVRGFFLVPDPFLFPEEYARRVSEIVHTAQIDVVVPVHEDALPLQQHRDLFPGGVRIVAPEVRQLERALSKWSVIEAAHREGVAAPRTSSPSSLREALSDAEQIKYPVLLKTRRGNSGKGVCLVRDPDGLRRAWHDLVSQHALRDDALPIVQEFIRGNVFGSCFLSANGRVVECFTEEYLHCKGGDFGTSTFRRFHDWPLLKEYTQRLVAALDWTGIGHFDFVGDPGRNEAYVIEMNPRYWGALKLSLGHGYNFPAASVALLVCREPVADYFPRLPGGDRDRPCLWLVGEMIALANALKKGEWSSMLGLGQRLRATGIRGLYDDWCWSDPLPFVVEAAYYFKEFVKSGFSTNPVKKGMLQ